MSDHGMEEAASAFEQVINPKPAAARSARRSDDEPSGPTENVFGNLGTLDADSDVAGGDDLPIKGAVQDGDDDEEVHGTNEELAEQGFTEEEIAAMRKATKPDAEEDEEEDEEAEEGDLDLEQEIEITVDGEKKTVKLEEAINGYIRQDTFHTRLNQLAEAKTLLQNEAVTIVETKKTVAAKLKEVEDTLKTLLPAEPDWDALYKEDAVKARALQKQYEDVKGKIEASKKEREELEKQAAEEEARATKVYRDSQFQEFIKNNPDIKDQKTLGSETQSMRRTALAAGFSEDELAETYDHRMLSILRKASKYDRMMASKPKAVKPSAARPNASGSRPATPDASSRRTTRQAPKGLANAQQRLARTGSVEAAADVFQNLLK